MQDFTHANETELQVRVARLLAQYSHCIDDDQLEQWPHFFTDPCIYRVIARDNLDRGMSQAAMFCDSRGMLHDRIVSLRHANIYEAHRYRHVVGSVLVNRVSADRLEARSSYAVFRTRTDGVSEVFSTGHYADVIVADGAHLRFQEKHVVFDTHRVDSLLVTPL